MADVHARKAREGYRPAPGLTQSASGLAYALFALALLLMGWRAVSVLTDGPPTTPESDFTQVAEAVIGPGKTRVIEGDTGTLLILIDGPEGTLSSANATKLRSLAGTLYPNAPAITIQQFEFADGLPGKPNPAALIELGLFGLFVLLAGGLVIRPLNRSPSLPPEARPLVSHASPTAPTPQVITPTTSVNSPATRSVEKFAQVASLAESEPKQTAAIISKWLRQEEGQA